MAGLKKITHIIPVGFSRERVLQSTKQYLVHKVILLLADGNPKEGKKIESVALDLEVAFKGFAEVECIRVVNEDVFDITLVLIRKIKQELNDGNEVMINASCSMRNIGIACYTASLITNTKMYTMIPKYKKSGGVEVEKVVEIPFLPLRDVSQEQMDILNALNNNRGVASLDELIVIMNPGMNKDTPAFTNERARICHHIRILRDTLGFLETEKIGKNLRVRLSKLGNLYVFGKNSV